MIQKKLIVGDFNTQVTWLESTISFTLKPYNN